MRTLGGVWSGSERAVAAVAERAAARAAEVKEAPTLADVAEAIDRLAHHVANTPLSQLGAEVGILLLLAMAVWLVFAFLAGLFRVLTRPPSRDAQERFDSTIVRIGHKAGVAVRRTWLRLRGRRK
jgi:hypothetical protein